MVQIPLKAVGAAVVPAAVQGPNPYEDPRCQETNSPYERIFSFFPQLYPWCSQALATYSDFLAIRGADRTCRHHTRIEALSPESG